MVTFLDPPIVAVSDIRKKQRRYYMKLLDTSQTRVMNFFSRVRHVIIVNVNSLLTSIKMFISVGFVIIVVVVLGVLLDVLVRISNYRNGTQYRTGQILKDLLTFLWNQSVEKTKAKWNSQKNS